MNIWPWSRIAALETANADLEAMVRSGAEKRGQLIASNHRLTDALGTKAERLRRIAELETPRCASIGRRMAKIARGEA